MTDADRLSNIERRLDEHGKKLDRIERALAEIAVQNSRIEDLQRDVSGLWAKWDAMTCPQTGILSRIQQQQASCPRGQIKFLWWFVAGVGTAIAGLAASLFKLVAYP